MAEGKVYIATVNGSASLPDGSTAQLVAGVTRVREGHPLLEGREALFKEMLVHYDVETARQAPKAETKPDPVKVAPEPEPEAKQEEKPAGLTTSSAPGAKAPAARPQRGPRKA
jgi:hypothetical protein